MDGKIGAGVGVNGLVAMGSKVEMCSHRSWSATIRPGVLPCHELASLFEPFETMVPPAMPRIVVVVR